MKTPKYDISKLVEYGIQTEETTQRIHVDLENNFVLVYRTEQGLQAMPDPISICTVDDWEASGYYLVSPPWLKGSQIGFATARGIRIPYTNIDGCRGARIPDVMQNNCNGSTTSKGRAALRIVSKMLQEGRLPIFLNITEVDEYKDQILGKDIDLCEEVIQVKCDKTSYKRGLFMQTHEWNPNGAH